MSAEATGWVFRHSPYRGAALAVHLAIADSVNDQHRNELWLSQRRLSTKARVGRQAVNDAMARLVADGFLALLEERTGRPNLYRFLWPDVPVVYESRTPVASDDTPARPAARPAPTGPVASDDTPPPPDLSPTTTPVSPQQTPPVASDDTEPKKPKRNPTTEEEARVATVEALRRRIAPAHRQQVDQAGRRPTRRLHAAIDRRLAGGWTPQQVVAAVLAVDLDTPRPCKHAPSLLADRIDDLPDTPPKPRPVSTTGTERLTVGTAEWEAAQQRQRRVVNERAGLTEEHADAS